MIVCYCGRRHRGIKMAGSEGLSVLRGITAKWRTVMGVSGYSIKVALVLSLIVTQTLSVPVSPPRRQSGQDRHLFHDQNQYEFARSLADYEISHPHRVSRDGTFISHQVHHRVRRDANDPWGQTNELHSTDGGNSNKVHYKVTIADATFNLTLTPNLKLISPNFVVEHRKYDFGNVSDSVITPYNDDYCHFTGVVDGHPGSLAALGTCYGLHGLLHTNQGAYFIEPIKGHDLSADGGHPHLVYKRSALPSHLDTTASLGNHLHDNHLHDNHADMQCGVKDDQRHDKDRETWQSLNPNAETESHSSHHRRKRSISLERYVETMIVVDDKMYEHYKDDDLRNYVLTIMNMVMTMYHDSTIGNDINIVLVRLVMGKIEIGDFMKSNSKQNTNQESTKLEVTHHAEKTLNSFCAWQKELNPPRSHPNHHDVAVLLTRYNICSKRNAPCSTLGLSHVSGMCQPHRSCNVNEDTGLALAYTVAHEIGHNFGMQHDNPGSGCTAGEGRQLVMSPVLNGASPLVWSNCSKDAITKFLDRDWGYCLNNEPTRIDFPFPKVPPGIMYDADHQCKLQYGSTAKHCSGIDDVCKTLWCKVDNKCLTRLEAAAQGTICGANKYCYGGNCMAYTDHAPDVIHGEWGSWGTWTGCSRTCGAGISFEERHCTNPHPSNGGNYCLGERRRYRICNTDSCPEASPDFRSVQCSAFDDVPYRGKVHKWEPVSTYDNSCQLHCKPAGEFFSVMMKDMVTDGTPCRLGRRDICIGGKCQKLGCDWLIDSNAKEDSCGVCHGAGTTCKTVKDEFKKKNGQGYVEAMVIPEGARNIRVEEVAEANNYLAVANDRGQYYLNGYWFIQWSGDYDAAGTVLHYTREGNQEKFFAPGPLKEPLHIMLLFQSQNPGVLSEYTVPNENATDGRVPVFFWKYLPWTHCTLSCGGGEQTRLVLCVEREAGVVDDFYCNISSKPYDMKRTCNNHLCPARWWAGPWQHCSVSCGDNGIHHRTVMCVRSHGQSEQQALDDFKCAAQEKPASIEPCHHKDPCPDASYWEAGPWSDCTGTCGRGTQTRSVTCLGQRHCKPELEPITSKDCYLDPCHTSKVTDSDHKDKSSNKKHMYNNYKYFQGDEPQTLEDSMEQGQGHEGAINDQNIASDEYGHFEGNPHVEMSEEVEIEHKWVPLPWTSCEEFCGADVVKTRELLCIELDTLNEVDQSQCDLTTKPLETESCGLEPCVDWTIGEWSECSVTCSDGTQSRSVACPQTNRCDPATRPAVSRICHPGDCIRWITGPWNECSQSCGGGLQYRHLQCVNQVTQESADGCDPNAKPSTEHGCHEEDCPNEQEELQEEKTYGHQCTGDSMSHTICKALKKMGQCRQRYVQIKCCHTCHSSIASPNKSRSGPAS